MATLLRSTDGVSPNGRSTSADGSPSRPPASCRRLRRLADQLVDARWPVTVAFVGLILVAWELWGVLGDLPSYLLAPSEIATALVDYLTDGTLWPATVSSMQRLGAGFVIGTSLGVLTGLLAGVLRPVEDVADPSCPSPTRYPRSLCSRRSPCGSASVTWPASWSSPSPASTPRSSTP